MSRHFKSISSLILLLSLLACNLPVEQVPPPGQVQTAAALTVQAVIMSPAYTATGAVSPAPATTSPAATGSPVTTTTLTTTVTPTYSVPMLTVRESTNCRTGPGEAYEIVFTYLGGKKLEIAGRSVQGNYWLVKSAESSTGTCWLWGEYVDVTGSYWAVSSVTPPPTSTSAPPRAPSIQKWDFNCSGGIMTFVFSWKDQAAGETGYRVFRNGEQVVELPPNSTTYTDTFNVSDNLTQVVEYYVQAYGPAGSANSSTMRPQCQSG